MEVFVVGDVAHRASVARWNWRAKQARALVAANFAAHQQSLHGEWCDLEESGRCSSDVAELGSSPGRIIHRWPKKTMFVGAMKACESTLSHMVSVFVRIMDTPDAGWIRVRGDVVLADLTAAAGEWLTDGFIVFEPVSRSVLSVDVEDRFGQSYLETTIIGVLFDDLVRCFAGHGPMLLPIVNEPGDRR